MMHVPTGPDGERERSWMTAGVLCVHGAEQGESLYGTVQLFLSPPSTLSRSLSHTFSLFSLFLLFFLLLSQIYTVSGVLSGAVTLYKSHTVTLKMVCSNALPLSLSAFPSFPSLLALSSFDSLSLSPALF